MQTTPSTPIVPAVRPSQTGSARAPGAEIASTAIAVTEARARMGAYLLQQGVINQLQLEYALQKNAIEGGKIGYTLIGHGLASESQISRFLATQRGIAFVDVSRLAAPEPEVFSLFNRDLCITHKFLPRARVDGSLEVVLGDGELATVADLVQRRTGLKAIFSQGEFTPVLQAIRSHFYDGV